MEDYSLLEYSVEKEFSKVLRPEKFLTYQPTLHWPFAVQEAQCQQRTAVGTRKSGKWGVSPTPSSHLGREGLPLPWTAAQAHPLGNTTYSSSPVAHFKAITASLRHIVNKVEEIYLFPQLRQSPPQTGSLVTPPFKEQKAVGRCFQRLPAAQA